MRLVYGTLLVPIAVAIGTNGGRTYFGRLGWLCPARARTIAHRAIARAGRSEHGHRLRREDFNFLETLDVLAVECVAERALETRQVDPLFLRHQADRLAPLAHPS